MVPGVAGEIAEANAEVAAVPGELRVPTAGEELRELSPEAAAHVAEAQAMVADTPGAPQLDLPKPKLPGSGKDVAPPEEPKPVAPDLLVTAPPGDAPKAVGANPSFVLTDAVKSLDQEKPAKPKVKPLWIVIALVVIGAVAAGVIVLAGGGSKKATTTRTTTQQPTTGRTTTTTPVRPEVAPTALQQQSLAPAGSSLVLASPGGAIQTLSAGTLKPLASTSDPAGPVGVSQSYGRLYVADRDTLTSFRLKDLAPMDAVSFPGAVTLIGGGNLALFALAKAGGGHGQLCRVTPQAVSPCASLPFAPAGGAVYAPAPGKSIVWLVDANTRTVVPNALGGGGLAGAGPVKLAAKPTGSPVVIGSKLYVPVTRGIAVVNLKTGKPVSTIALPATPVALAGARETACSPRCSRPGRWPSSRRGRSPSWSRRERARSRSRPRPGTSTS